MSQIDHLLSIILMSNWNFFLSDQTGLLSGQNFVPGLTNALFIDKNYLQPVTNEIICVAECQLSWLFMKAIRKCHERWENLQKPWKHLFSACFHHISCSPKFNFVYPNSTDIQGNFSITYVLFKQFDHA